MHAFCAALFLTLLPASPLENVDTQVVRLDWSRAVPGEPDLVAMRQAYASAVNARDVQRASELYTKDALAILADGRVVRGAEAIGLRLSAESPAGAVVTLLPKRFSSSATVASETGTFTEALPDTNGTSSVEGVYVTVYARAPGGQWRIALEVRTTGGRSSLAVW